MVWGGRWGVKLRSVCGVCACMYGMCSHCRKPESGESAER